ncbi:MAG: TRAP transporter small permease [Oscillospiraceae bacterium]|nr:TRAP transporter small permease [Oscillospiraceae bacterium]
MEKKGLIYHLNAIEEKALVYSFAFSLVLVFVQVCFREAGHSLSWSEEIARYLFIWQCWMSVSLAERSKVHIRIFMATQGLPKKVRWVIEILVNLSVIAINVFFIYWGIAMVKFLINAGTTSTACKIPMWIIYLAMPLGSFTYSLRLCGNVYRLLTGKQEV